MLKINFVRNLIVMIMVIFLMNISVVNLNAAEEYAPRVKVPSNMENRSWFVNVIKKWELPTQAEVGFPAYPGSIVVSFKAKSQMDMNGKMYNTLPTLILATKDPQSKVLAFYKEKLKSWSYKNSFGMFDVFWKGKEKFNNLDMRQSTQIPNVILMKANVPYTEFMPNAKTTISIVYKSAK